MALYASCVFCNVAKLLHMFAVNALVSDSSSKLVHSYCTSQQPHTAARMWCWCSVGLADCCSKRSASQNVVAQSPLHKSGM